MLSHLNLRHRTHPKAVSRGSLSDSTSACPASWGCLLQGPHSAWTQVLRQTPLGPSLSPSFPFHTYVTFCFLLVTCDQPTGDAKGRPSQTQQSRTQLKKQSLGPEPHLSPGPWGSVALQPLPRAHRHSETSGEVNCSSWLRSQFCNAFLSF